MSVSAEEREAKQKNAEIERDLRRSAKEYENTIKILLLGEQCLCVFKLDMVKDRDL